MRKYLLGFGVCALALGACDDEEPLPAFPEAPCPATLEARTLTGEIAPFTVGDNVADQATGFQISGGTPDPEVAGIQGLGSEFVVVDGDGVIRFVGSDSTALAGFDIDAEEGGGQYAIYNVVRQFTLGGFTPDSAFSDVTGCFAVSNPINVEVGTCPITAGTISGPDSLIFDIGDDEPDNLPVDRLTVEGVEGDRAVYVLTNQEDLIFGVYESLEALGEVDFGSSEVAGDTVLLYVASIAEASAPASAGGLDFGDTTSTNLSEVQGCFEASEEAYVITRNGCNVDGGSLPDVEFAFEVGEDSYFVTDLEVDGANGPNMTYVVTDEGGQILGLPPTSEALAGVDFNAAGPGTCLIWHLSFADDLRGAEAGQNAGDLVGCFDLSNSVAVRRNCSANGGSLSGGPFQFTVNDGTLDTIPSAGLSLTGEFGESTTFVITDADGTILELIPTLEDVLLIDFDDRAPGSRLLWHLAFNSSVTGAEIGENANDLGGCFDLSNSVAITLSEE